MRFDSWFLTNICLASGRWTLCCLCEWRPFRVHSNLMHRWISLDRLFNRLRFIAKTCFVSTQISYEICKHFCALFNNSTNKIYGTSWSEFDSPGEHSCSHIRALPLHIQLHLFLPCTAHIRTPRGTKMMVLPSLSSTQTTPNNIYTAHENAQNRKQYTVSRCKKVIYHWRPDVCNIADAPNSTNTNKIYKRQGYSTHFEAAGHVIGDKEGVRNDGKFFLNSKLYGVYFALLKLFNYYLEMDKLNNNSLGWMRQFAASIQCVPLCFPSGSIGPRKWSGKSIMFLDCVIL